ncbi:restriction endonuclease subunit S [Veillonella dispar]|nr:restriction endonuclease subunit S [Veillonella dispar]VEG94428.1 EcoKI restriction-modification system protein HsdS [Veillonella dispar]
MAKNNKMPAIRFSGYTDAWEQRKLSEVVTINPKTELPDKFKYVDLESVVGTNLLGFQVIKKENAPSRAQRLASYGDVFYQTVRPYQRNNYLFENIDKDMVFSTGYAQLRSKLDSYFLLTLVQNDNFVKVVLDNCTGTSYPAINGSELGKITVQIPSNDEEANQIGKVFRGIDNIITLHQRKLEKLKLIKKALLQKLFPQHGSNIPELRFKGFTDAWEQRKLSEFVDKAVDNRGKTPPLDENGAHPLIEVAALGGVYPDYSKVEKYLSDDVFNTNLRAYIKKDDILFTTVGSIGLVSLMDSREEAAIAQNIVAFRAKENFLPEYLYALFSNEDNQYKAKRIAMVAVQPSIKVSQLVNVEYMISTNIEEQERIGVFFSSLQSLITLHQRKLDMLKNVKKGLLQKMFV